MVFYGKIRETCILGHIARYVLLEDSSWVWEQGERYEKVGRAESEVGNNVIIMSKIKTRKKE